MRSPSADDLAPFSVRVKALAELLEQISVREGVFVIRRHDDPERELVIVPSSLCECVIASFTTALEVHIRPMKQPPPMLFAHSGGHTSKPMSASTSLVVPRARNSCGSGRPQERF